MQVRVNHTLYVENKNERIMLEKGDTADVDGRTYHDGHMFIKSGYLVPVKKEPKK